MFKDVNVAGVIYKTELKKDLMQKDGLFGRVTYYDSVISLEETLSEERMEQVFIHELLHAIFYEAGYDEQEEGMINRIGKVLYQVLKDNPEILQKEV